LYKIKKTGKPKPEIRDKLKEFVEKNPDQVLWEIKVEFWWKNGQKTRESRISDDLERLNFKLKKSPIICGIKLKKREVYQQEIAEIRAENSDFF